MAWVNAYIMDWERIESAVRRYPETIVPYGRIFIDSPESVAEIDRFAAEEARVIKMHTPRYNWDNPEYVPTYERIERHKMLALFHTGIASPMDGPEYSGMARMRPECFDTISRAYGDPGYSGNALQVEFFGRMANACGGTEDHYYSQKGSLETASGKVSGDDGLVDRYEKLAGRSADVLPDKQLFEGPAHKPGRQSSGEDELRADARTSAHMKNWIECVRSRKAPVVNIHAGVGHSIVLCMAITALHTGERLHSTKRLKISCPFEVQEES